MNAGPAHASLETLHPALWRASQLAQAPASVVLTGHGALDAVLPGGGWPLGGLIEFCLAQPGIGEIRLLHPALAALGPGPVVLAQPPCPPCADSWPSSLASPCLWLRPHRPADALWAAEQVLRSRAFSALLVWQQSVSFQALRRLQLAAQAGRTLCVLYRPWRACPQSSPAPLRLALQPMPGGLTAQVLKRRGHPHTQPISLRLETHALTNMPSHPSLHKTKSMDALSVQVSKRNNGCSHLEDSPRSSEEENALSCVATETARQGPASCFG